MTRKACFKPYRKESNKKNLRFRAPCERHQAAPRWMRGTAWTCCQSQHQAAPRWMRGTAWTCRQSRHQAAPRWMRGTAWTCCQSQHQAAPRWMRGTAWTCRQSRHQAAPRWARDCLRWLLLEFGLFSFVQLPSFFLQILGRDFTLVMFGQKRALGLVIKVHNAGA